MEATGGECRIAVGVAGSSLRDKVVAKVKKMLRLLHEAGYVHGDVRALNVLYRVGESEEEGEHQHDVSARIALSQSRMTIRASHESSNESYLESSGLCP